MSGTAASGGRKNDRGPDGRHGLGQDDRWQGVAKQLGWKFYDADDYHPAANIEKMRQGIPLTDEDRKPWLETLAKLIDDARDRGENIVLACSALKHAYQEYLRHHLDVVRYVCLCGPPEVIQKRLAARTGHFMNPALLLQPARDSGAARGCDQSRCDRESRTDRG